MTVKSRIGDEEYKGVFVLGCFRPSSWSEARLSSESFRHSPNPDVGRRTGDLVAHALVATPISVQGWGVSRAAANLVAARRASR